MTRSCSRDREVTTAKSLARCGRPGGAAAVERGMLGVGWYPHTRVQAPGGNQSVCAAPRALLRGARRKAAHTRRARRGGRQGPAGAERRQRPDLPARRANVLTQATTENETFATKTYGARRVEEKV